MTLADFTRPGLIIEHLDSRDAGSAIHELSMALHRGGCIPDWLPFYHEALNREFLLSTDTEAGMACPHARLPGLRELAFAFGRSDRPFSWGPGVAHPVRMVFLLAVPPANPEHYLALVAALARLAGDDSLLETIRRAPDGAGLMAAFSRVALRGSPQPAASLQAGFR
ncbi:MAG TPA: PTS sugar transporter subunit IIA [Opitutaceae bacterium]|nr:PTS sugar transporter subunit IIA [Opitutaceae bacterium]